jgi:hypothetical protein
MRVDVRGKGSVLGERSKFKRERWGLGGISEKGKIC